MENTTIREEIEGLNQNIEEVSREEVSSFGTTGEKFQFDTSFLMTKTGPNTIEDYIDHPLNFNESKGLAQVLRGATGLFGALDLAIIDIIVGILQFAKERKKEVVQNVATN